MTGPDRERRMLVGGTLGLLLSQARAGGEADGRPVAPNAGGTPAAGDTDGRAPADAASGESLALARHVALSRFEALPPAAATMAKRSILDAIGVSLAASGLEPACGPFLELALASGGAPAATVLGMGGRAPLLMAALANGSLAHALDYEDAHDESLTHPNAAPVAAALSLADALGGVSGREFIQAVALGSDVTCRLSLAQGNVGVLPRAFYPPAIVGTMGATATAARLLRLSPEQVLDAWSLAMCTNSCSAEILSEAYSDLRAVRDGPCAQAGVQAALLAARGVKGFSRPIEGERAFYAMYAGGRCSPGRLVRGLGTRFEGQYVGFKAWPACRSNHPYIQAALEGMRRDPVTPSDVVAIRAHVDQGSLIVCEPAAEKRRPRAAIDAKFSVYYTVAAAMVDGRIDLHSYGHESLRRPDVLALADRIHYVVDPAGTGPGVDGRGNLLEVQLRDGTTRAWGIGALLGSLDLPLGEDALVRKFVDCGRAARRPQSPDRLGALARQLLALEQVADLRAITRRL